MFKNFKLTVLGKNIYKEVELTASVDEIHIGTSADCGVRLRKELFLSDIDLMLVRRNDIWSVSCGEGLYLTTDGTRKLYNQELNHGDELLVRYANQDVDIFKLYFIINFEYETQLYNLEIDLAGHHQIKIGGDPNSEICFTKLGSDYVTVELADKGAIVTDCRTSYGVWVNEERIHDKCLIHDRDFFSIVDISFYYKEGKLYTCNRDDIKISGVEYKLIEQQTTHFVFPKFNRNTRIQYQLPDVELEIKPAKELPAKNKSSIFLTLVPAFVMLAMTVLLRGVLGNGGTFVIYSTVSMAMGIITSVITYFGDRKKYNEEYQKRIDDYNIYIESKREAIEQARTDEIRVRNLIYPSIEEDIQAADTFDKRLFEKTAGDKDFLQIYLGRGRVASQNPVKYTSPEFVNPEDPLEPVPEQVSKEYQYIEDAPVYSDFNASCGIGIVGNIEVLNGFIKNIVLDLVTRHFYTDVRMVCIFDDRYAQNLSWIKWLHNIDNDKAGIRNIACDEESRNMIIEYLYAILSMRSEAKKTDQQIQKPEMTDQYVVLITDAELISNHPVSKFIANSAEYGFTFVFLVEYEEYLPMGCTEVIRLDDALSGTLINAANGDIVQHFDYPAISDETAKRVALKLGAVEIDEVSLESELTKNITFFELLNIFAPEDLNLKERWADSQVYKTMAAPLGVKNHGEIVYLDISDEASAHGPHGLVAGTTGSGKSEILQTYILSMVTLFHPYDVGFVLIDFKGGGMSNQFKNLPHLIGTITNIDGREINRSLLSIKAELVKRQELFSEAGVNHINDYIKLYKEHKVSVPLPHLIIIVDEFAELKAEYPDFMKELVSAARIGRTLGVHLILATQKPAGVVDAQIWSNSKFKLCLKVQTREDSSEVLKSPLAAEIVEPGRAYFQVGNNEIFDLFQSAYSGAPVPSGGEVNERIYGIYELNIWGKKTLKYTNKKKTNDEQNTPQLNAVIEHVSNYCKAVGIRKLPGICLPPLPDRLGTDELSYQSEELGVVVPIGIIDDPECQRQEELTINLARDNVYIVGSSQMGKTVMLQTILYGLMRRYTSSQVNIYIVDCGSRVLKLFEESKYVGGVVLSDEEEKCKNLFKLINSTITERKKILSGKGVGNYFSYLETGSCDMPLIAVIIENIAAFKEYFPNQFEEIGSLVRESQSVGISFLFTSMTANGLTSRIQANLGEKIVLNCNDSGEYSNVIGHCKQTPKEVPGRGLVMRDKRVLEFHTAIFGKGQREKERSDELTAYIKDRNAQMREHAKLIPLIPEHLVLDALMDASPELFRESGILPVGMGFENVDVTAINMNTTSSLTLIGVAESRTAFLTNLFRMIQKTVIFHSAEAYVVDDHKNQVLQEYERTGFVTAYTTDVLEGIDIVMTFCNMLEHRSADADRSTRMMLVLNSPELLKKIYADKTMCKMLAEAMKNAAESCGFILLSGVENQPVSFSANDLLKTVKEERQAILFAQLTDNKVFDVSGRIKPDPSYDVTIGYRFEGSRLSKIKIFDAAEHD